MNRRQYNNRKRKQAPQAWKNEQRHLKRRIEYQNAYAVENIQYIGGLDLSFSKVDKTQAVVCLSIFTYPACTFVEKFSRVVTLEQEYIPGYLAFREVDHYLKIFDDVRNTDVCPQVILVDGNGILHYRGCGSASHFGVLADVMCIGVAKKLLVCDGISPSDIPADLCRVRFQACELVGNHGVLGKVLCTQLYQDPVFVSIGHKVDLETACQIVTQCVQNDRCPEPIASADAIGRQEVRELDERLGIESQPKYKVLKPVIIREGLSRDSKATGSLRLHETVKFIKIVKYSPEQRIRGQLPNGHWVSIMNMTNGFHWMEKQLKRAANETEI